MAKRREEVLPLALSFYGGHPDGFIQRFVSMRALVVTEVLLRSIAT